MKPDTCPRRTSKPWRRGRATISGTAMRLTGIWKPTIPARIWDAPTISITTLSIKMATISRATRAAMRWAAMDACMPVRWSWSLKKISAGARARSTRKSILKNQRINKASPRRRHAEGRTAGLERRCRADGLPEYPCGTLMQTNSASDDDVGASIGIELPFSLPTRWWRFLIFLPRADL